MSLTSIVVGVVSVRELIIGSDDGRSSPSKISFFKEHILTRGGYLCVLVCNRTKKAAFNHSHTNAGGTVQRTLLNWALGIRSSISGRTQPHTM